MLIQKKYKKIQRIQKTEANFLNYSYSCTANLLGFKNLTGLAIATKPYIVQGTTYGFAIGIPSE
ncbi:hypothetical protein FACS189426_22180 [Bacteroidia bacterium]|nr:hypothetical protein FACS189426_22180 [Bacteroidia bacterium]GHT85265.1 hypothetical protein FACS18947_3810 [Bacteroidia bacterium]